MKHTITNQTDTEATITIELDPSDLKPFVKQAYDTLRGRVKVAGFRPGKAPDHLVERELGSSAIQSEVIELATVKSYSDSIKALDLPVIASPQVSLAKFTPYDVLEYEAKVELMPKVTLGDYKNLKIKKPDVAVGDKEIDEVITDLQKRSAEKVKVTRPAKHADEVTFDFAGSLDGKPVPGATDTGYTLELGSGKFIPGFEDELIGLSPSDAKTFDITFPKDYQEASLAGQKVTFDIKLHDVTEIQHPEVTDEFAAKVGPFKTVDELRADVRRMLEDQATDKAAKEHEQAVLEQVQKQAKYTVPPSLVEQQMTKLKAELSQNLAYNGLDIDKYIQMSGKTMDDLEAEMKPEAERRIGLAMVLTEIAKAEKLEVSVQEVEMELARLRAAYTDAATQAELARPETREEIYNHLMTSKVIAKILTYVKA